MKTIYINNNKYNFEGEPTILEVVREKAGDIIPVICHHNTLEPHGSCRICSVDVALQKDGPRKVMASCHTPASDGMHIFTDSERVVKLRKNIAELVLSDYPEDKTEAAKNKLPTEFQRLLERLGVYKTRYNAKETHTDQEKDTLHPYIKSDLSQCIRCYRCVRACDEIQGKFILNIYGRGYDNRIIKDSDSSFTDSECVSCGACVQACPTGAIYDLYESKIQPYDKIVHTVCTYCGVGCNLEVRVKDGKIMGIEAPDDAEVNAAHTCIKGRYAFEFYNHPDRLTTPLIKKNGRQVPVSWDEAYDHIANKLNKIKEQYGPDAIGGISSSRCTNEENYLMQKFMRAVVGTNNIDGCARVCHAPTAYGMQKAFGTGAATNSITDLEHTDCILVIGANPTSAHPVTGSKIKQQAMKGKTLIVIDPVKTELAEIADYHLQLRPGTNIALLNMFAYYLIKNDLLDHEFIKNRTTGFEEFKEQILKVNIDEYERITTVDKHLVEKAAEAFAKAGNAMSFHGLGVTEHYTGSRTVMLLANISMFTGNIGRKGVGVNPLRGQNNVQGAADMGVQPHQGAGYLDVNDPEIQKYYKEKYGIETIPEKEGLKIPEMFDGAINKTVKAMWIMGEDVMQTDPNTQHVRKALEGLDFLVVQELFPTETSKMADVVLPAASFFEKEGTFTNGERRIQKVNKVVEPIEGTKADGQIMVDIMNRMGYPQKGYSADVLLREIADVVPFFAGVTWENLGTNGLQWPVTKDGKDTKILHSKEFKIGKGQIHFFDFEETPELIDNRDKYPFILTTGRNLEHYNSGTMTRRTPNKDVLTEDNLWINPADAKKKGIKTGDRVRLISARGETYIKAFVTDKVKEGVLRSTFHFPEVSINNLTGDIGDIETLTPEYKVVAVDVVAGG
ncbi:MAG: formate dehydrogenase subunit alpha [Chlorobi bacterium]|nr:formate dehydrogenase subunit alpha [Chlorobiota bacterium]